MDYGGDNYLVALVDKGQDKVGCDWWNGGKPCVPSGKFHIWDKDTGGQR